MHVWRFAAVAAIGCFLSVGACVGDEPTVQPGGETDGGVVVDGTVPADGNDPGQTDTGAQLDGGGGDTGAQTDTGTHVDASDGGPIDASACLALTVNDTVGIFVVPSGVDGSTCGSRAQPCATIQYGIDLAVNGGKTTVYVAGSLTPYVGSITLKPGITVEGGWAASGTQWTPNCSSTRGSAVTIQATTAVVVTASALGGSAGLKSLTLKSKAIPAVGESLYGVLATGATTQVSLDEVWIEVAAGGAGANGAAGSAGSPGGAGCVSGNGGAGAQGANGAGATAGSFSESGYAAGAGGAASGGGAGQNGTANDAGCASCVTCVAACNTTQSCNAVAQGTQCSYGAGGCGATGGTGGTGATSGGSSIGIFAWAAHVAIVGGRVASGNGGNGGTGGIGGSGGNGSNGTAGTAVSCVTGCWSCQDILAGDAIDCMNPTAGISTDISAAPAGTKGGNGGTGGNAGGGSGGHSYAIYSGGSAVVNPTGATLSHGVAGTGGAAGGATGVAADQGP